MTLSRPEQRVEIGRGPPYQVADVQVMQIGDGGGYPTNVGGLVAFAAMRDWREKRTIGLNQHAIEGHRADCFAEVGGFRERNDAGERDVEAEIEPGARERRTAGKTVQHAAQLTSAFVCEDRDRVLV